MIFSFPAKWLGKLFGSHQRAEKLRLLQQQRFLLHQGLETTAEVLDRRLQPGQVGHLFSLRLMLKVRQADGSYFYTHSLTLVNHPRLPAKGEILRIRYLPGNLLSVLLV